MKIFLLLVYSVFATDYVDKYLKGKLKTPLGDIVECESCHEDAKNLIDNALKKVSESTGNSEQLQRDLVLNTLGNVIIKEIKNISEEIIDQGYSKELGTKLKEYLKLYEELVLFPVATLIVHYHRNEDYDADEMEKLKSLLNPLWNIPTYKKNIMGPLWKKMAGEGKSSMAMLVRNMSLKAEYFSKLADKTKYKSIKAEISLNGIPLSNKNHSISGIDKFFFGDRGTLNRPMSKSVLGIVKKDVALEEARSMRQKRADEIEMIKSDIREERNERIRGGELLSKKMAIKISLYQRDLAKLQQKYQQACQLAQWNGQIQKCREVQEEFQTMRPILLKGLKRSLEQYKEDKELENSLRASDETFITPLNEVSMMQRPGMNGRGPSNIPPFQRTPYQTPFNGQYPLMGNHVFQNYLPQMRGMFMNNRPQQNLYPYGAFWDIENPYISPTVW